MTTRRPLAALAVVFALAMAGATMLAPTADARCIYGSGPSCILQECMDCVPTLPPWACDIFTEGCPLP